MRRLNVAPIEETKLGISYPCPGKYVNTRRGIPHSPKKNAICIILYSIIRYG